MAVKSMQYKDYYKILGVEKSATAKEIKAAYHKLAKKHHPDVNKNKGSDAMFKDLNEAYEVLGDAEKRKKYDTLGANWDKYQNFDSGRYAHQDMGDINGTKFYGSDFSDFFEIFFGGKGAPSGGASSGGTASPFDNIFSNLGFGGNSKNQSKKTSQTYQNPANQKTQQSQQPQPEKHNEVEFEVTLHEVYEGGKKHVLVGEKKLDVNIPKGVEDGTKIRIPKGDNGKDVYLKVKIKDHHLYKLEEKNIIYEVPVSDYEAVLGTEVIIPTLTGSSINLKIPPETQAGKMFRLKKLGMPNRKNDEKGDMFVKVKIMIPKSLSEKELDIYKELKRLRTGKDNFRS